MQHIFFPKSCPSCGNQLLYGSGKKELQCRKCKYTVSLQRNSDQVAERKLKSGARFDNFQKGMGDRVVARSCTSCSAMIATHEDLVLEACPICQGKKLEPKLSLDRTLEPKDVLPFTIPEHRARQLLRRFLRKRRPWMLPRAIFQTYQKDRLRPLYVSAFLLDAYVRASWKAQAGFRVPFNNRGNVSEKEVWEPVTGYWENLFFDLFFLASSKINAQVFSRIQDDYSLRDLVNYDPAYLASFPAEVTETLPMDAVKHAEKEIDEKLKETAASKIKGEKNKDLKILAEKDALTFRHVLLPVWVSSFHYKGQHFQYLINGRTGKVAGDKPISVLRIFVLAGLLLLLVILIVWLTIIF